MTSVTLTVDARRATDGFLPQGDVGPLINTWERFEPDLYGCVLTAGQALELRPLDEQGRSLGTVIVTVAHPTRTAITPETEFEIVSVVERPRIARVYRCATCDQAHQTAYGPFTCRDCPEDHARVCDDHVQLLPGSLDGTCPLHVPRCHCGQPATAYCSGPRCRPRKAWCAQHLHMRDADAYCAPCYAEKFPACTSSNCAAVGSLACQHVEHTGRACGRRVCPRHATSWQVFGPEISGLMRCELHSDVLRQGPDDMVFQILASAALRLHELQERVPRIAGFRYILAKPRRINPSVPEAYEYVLRAPMVTPVLQAQIEKVIQRNRTQWDREVNEGVTALENALTRLRSWLQSAGSTNALATLEGLTWMAARPDRPATLLIRVDARYFAYEARQRAEQALGFRIQVRKEG